MDCAPHRGNKCSWCDCSELMRFWLIVIDFIYMTFISPFSHWRIESRGKAHTPIELIRRSLLCRLIAADSRASCAFGGPPVSHRCFSRTPLPSRRSWHRSQEDKQELCMWPNCPGLRPNVYHPAALWLAHSSSCIDFPLRCHCGFLFKHTSHDVWPSCCLEQQVKASAEKKRCRGPIWWFIRRTVAFLYFKEHFIFLFFFCKKQTARE